MTEKNTALSALAAKAYAALAAEDFDAADLIGDEMISLDPLATDTCIVNLMAMFNLTAKDQINLYDPDVQNTGFWQNLIKHGDEDTLRALWQSSDPLEVARAEQYLAEESVWGAEQAHACYRALSDHHMKDADQTLHKLYSAKEIACYKLIHELEKKHRDSVNYRAAMKKLEEGDTHEAEFLMAGNNDPGAIAYREKKAAEEKKAREIKAQQEKKSDHIMLITYIVTAGIFLLGVILMAVAFLTSLPLSTVPLYIGALFATPTLMWIALAVGNYIAKDELGGHLIIKWVAFLVLMLLAQLIILKIKGGA